MGLTDPRRWAWRAGVHVRVSIDSGGLRERAGVILHAASRRSALSFLKVFLIAKCLLLFVAVDNHDSFEPAARLNVHIPVGSRFFEELLLGELRICRLQPGDLCLPKQRLVRLIIQTSQIALNFVPTFPVLPFLTLKSIHQTS